MGSSASDAASGLPDRTSKEEYGEHFVRLYDQLRGLARRELGDSARTSLDTTSLVHEAFLRLDGKGAEDRGHMLALAARAMRYVLIDHVRAQAADKRGGALERVPLLTGLVQTGGRDIHDLLEIDRGLEALQELEPRLVSVVECRYFGGMEFPEIGHALGISERTAQRDWRRARAFLQAWFTESP